MFGARSLIALVIVVCWGSSPVLSADCTADSLRPFFGDWKADGWWRADADAEATRVLCRLSFSSTPDGMRVDTSGKCASDGKAQAVNGWMACKNGSLRGPLLTLEGDRTQKLTTVRSGPSGLSINVTTVTDDGGPAGHYRLDVMMAEDAITLSFGGVEIATDGFHSAKLKLKRAR